MLALVGDGHARDGDVGLAAILDGRHQRVEVLAGQPVDLKTHMLGERLGYVDVKSLGLARRLVHRLEGREEEVGDASELALVDDGVLAIGRSRGRAGVGAATASRKQACGNKCATLQKLTT